MMGDGFFAGEQGEEETVAGFGGWGETLKIELLIHIRTIKLDSIYAKDRKFICTIDWKF